MLNWENFYDQPIDSDIKWFEKIKKLITGQGEDYSTGSLFDYEYVESHCKLNTVNLIRKKELDAVLKAVPQIKFVGQLKNPNHEVAANESMFFLTILEKLKETRLKFPQGSVKVYYKSWLVIKKQEQNWQVHN